MILYMYATSVPVAAWQVRLRTAIYLYTLFLLLLFTIPVACNYWSRSGLLSDISDSSDACYSYKTSELSR